MLFTKYRPAFILLLIGVGIYMQFTYGTAVAMYLYGAALVMLLSPLLFDNVLSAFGLLKRGKPELAAQLLSKVWTPKLLVKSHKAYYHFTKGMLALQTRALDPALEELMISHQIGLKTAQDNALNTLNIAHIFFAKKDKKNTQTFLEKTKTFNADDLMLKEKIEEMELALKKMK